MKSSEASLMALYVKMDFSVYGVSGFSMVF
jgi:hypothetical protein